MVTIIFFFKSTAEYSNLSFVVSKDSQPILCSVVACSCLDGDANGIRLIPEENMEITSFPYDVSVKVHCPSRLLIIFIRNQDLGFRKRDVDVSAL